jgi:hypothetical protein
VNNALLVNFNTGNALSVAKNEAFNVRAIRAISCPELPSSITGTASVCVGSTTAFSTATAGGTWSSSATGIATVSASGVVTGVAAGTATISYTVTESCGSASATRVVTVNTVPSVGAITGADSVGESSSITLNSTVSGGIWTTSNSAIATINSGGVITGISLGTTTVSYAVSNTCGTAIETKLIVVRPLSVGDSYGDGIVAYILQPEDHGYITSETQG